MAFDQSTISEITVKRSGGDLKIAWTSSAADGTWFQVYVGRRLTWYGKERSLKIPWPTERVPVDVGAVLPTECVTDFSGSLPGLPLNRACLTWQGGTFLAAGIAGYAIYGSASPGGSVSFAKPLARIKAYQGALTDGFNLGGFSAGGFGLSAGDYSWTSSPLSSGNWSFAVVPYDFAGNACASQTTTTVTIAAAPRPPASDANGNRLAYSFNATTHVATLNWQSSPA